MLTFSMTFSSRILNPVFKVSIFEIEYLKKVRLTDKVIIIVYYTMLLW